MSTLLWQFIALSTYVLMAGVVFCDGFKLHIVRKLVWFGVFVAIALSVYAQTGMFVVERIIPLPSILAILLGWSQIQARERNA